MIHRCLTDPTVEDVDILGSLRVRPRAAVVVRVRER